MNKKEWFEKILMNFDSIKKIDKRVERAEKAAEKEWEKFNVLTEQKPDSIEDGDYVLDDKIISIVNTDYRVHVEITDKPTYIKV